jgi:hypothetical protein
VRVNASLALDCSEVIVKQNIQGTGDQYSQIPLRSEKVHITYCFHFVTKLYNNIIGDDRIWFEHLQMTMHIWQLMIS